jgi:uncharacterized protein YndB with AHSA1/START domain
MTSSTSLTVSRSINAPAAQIFDLLTNPDRHVEFDGSGFLRSSDKAQRITKVGQQFRMNMEGPHMGGEYQTDNHVTGYAENKLVAWKTAPAGEEPPGWEWVYELKSEGSGDTEVSLTYDWSKVTDQKLIKQVPIPLVSADDLESSLASLAAALHS